MAKQTFTATATWKENLLVETESRGHRILIDEPQELGGSDKGMNPVEVVLSALGACQAIVARTYASQFGIDLKGFRVTVEGDLDTDGFLNKSNVRPGFSNIRYIFHIDTEAPAEKISAYQEFIETHCPVGDTLANPVALKASQVIVEHPTY
ncbi:OsmC family protein [Virgibacillus halophilus]|uniref:OsmC family protein n=1 Tax=Tigheibacillus halophilus TaxID=361280 RepID=A0ABU5C2S0_9BACI|nr:OsmC family protein [Virgibacillus halophilus]